MASTSNTNKPQVVAFSDLTPWERAGVRFLRGAHFLLARSGLFVAFFLLSLLGERADYETQPPTHPWIIYVHASIYLLTSTGMSTRLLPAISVFVAAIFYLHLAYLLNFEPAFGYPPWLRVRVGLRLVGAAGASIRMLAAGDFDISRHCDKLGAILSGCGCALMSILSLPIRAPIHPDKVAHLHEIASAFPSIFVSHFIHWVLGLAFGLAFLAYTFPVLVALPSDRTEASLFARMVTWADRFACTGWGLTLLCKDTNWAYWKAQGVEFWLQSTNILAEVITIASLVVGASLPWIGKVTNAEHRKKE